MTIEFNNEDDISNVQQTIVGRIDGGSLKTKHFREVKIYFESARYITMNVLLHGPFGPNNLQNRFHRGTTSYRKAYTGMGMSYVLKLSCGDTITLPPQGLLNSLIV